MANEGPEPDLGILGWLPHRTFFRHDKQRPYLTRFRLLRLGPYQVNIHLFHGSDEDNELHSHPWSGFGVILRNGYVEERLGPDKLAWKRTLIPGSVNVLGPDTFHKVTLLNGRRTWTLFVTGRDVASWGFLDMDSKEFIHHHDYNERKRRDL